MTNDYLDYVFCLFLFLVDRKYGENWFEELRFNYNTFYFFDEIDVYFCSREGEPLVINQDFRPYQVMLATEKAGLNPSKAEG